MPRRSRSRAAYFQRYNAARGRRASKTEVSGARLILGIDGEGYTRADGSHRYVYLAASSRDGLHSDVRNPKGLTAAQVFRWLVSLPRKALLVGFALGYDKTKWVETWPDERVWRLMHPESRLGEVGPLPVDCGPWRVNLVATRFGVKHKRTGEHRTAWDVWKFFQCSFVKAIERWDVGTRRERKFIERQKARRGAFARIGKTEELYCQLECRLLADLVGKLLAAHEEAGIKLRSYYGPGSTAAVVLAELGADVQRARVPDRMALAVASAYFGGRFEISHVGPVRARKLYPYDLANAYPWAFTRMPCMAHGTWVRRKTGSLKGRHPIATCVRFEVRPHARANPAWGPLPHRLPDGNILFPTESAGGWAWREEFEAARKLHPGVTALETWSWRPHCTCKPPFAARVRELFELRKAWGKNGRGLVLKLLLNSLYGKSAQKAGKGRFRCMVRAGLVTSMVRARLLRAIALVDNPWDVLEVATDGILCRVPIPGLRAARKNPALGAWEAKTWRGGVHFIRPGMRFPIAAGAPLESTTARGLGPKVLHANRKRVMRAWARRPMAPITLPTPSFFHGATLSVRGTKKDEAGQPTEFARDGEYGLWTSEKRTLTYGPRPKRESLRPDFTCELWRLPRGAGCESVPYGVSPQSAIADELDKMRELEEDQPDHAGVAML